ncbi:ARP2/3 complex 16 kDa subunit (p16-Arc)-domain-containing protein [Entophlyctis helioformis]|nr:ARP2/3 complex 16 kDa subunit (p16-Arc)-domain-containing protein [Entophlyctis helioformis]
MVVVPVLWLPGTVSAAALTRGWIGRLAGWLHVNTQERATQLVVEALAAARPSDIAAIVGQLPPQLVDTLMKYLYRAMASPDVFSSALLLSWHEKVYEVGGVGSVVRVLTDRRSV